MKTIREYCKEIEIAIWIQRAKGNRDSCLMPLLPYDMAETYADAMYFLISEVYGGYRGLLPAPLEEIVREMLTAAQATYVTAQREEAEEAEEDWGDYEEDDGDHPDYDPYCGCDMIDCDSADDIW